MTSSLTKVPYANGTVEVTVAGTDLSSDNLEISATRDAVCSKPMGTATEQKFTVTFPNNTGIAEIEYSISVIVKGQTDKKEVNVTVNGVNTISGKEALNKPTCILDVRDQETISLTGSIPGSRFCPQFPLTDESLDENMQKFAEIYKNSMEPIYILCKTGLGGAPKATKNLLAAGIEPGRIFTILLGATDEDIQAAFVNAKTGWQKDSKGWWYRNADGSYPFSCWQKIDEEWYYFNSVGYRVTGWQAIGGAWYYFDKETGIMASNEWVDGDRYYMTSTGAMATAGWLQLKDGWYYLNASGAKVTGWQAIGGAWYYFDKETGIMASNEWVDGDRYYVTSSGAMKTGWLMLKEGWYYLNGNGAKVTGWEKVDGTWYYMDTKTGVMASNEWVDGDRYYVTSTGAMKTGWLQLGSDWYYLSGSGAKVTNQWVGNYYLKEDGKMAVSEWVDHGKYYVDENGAWVPNKTK